MAFVTKTWKDRLVEFAGRRKLKNVSTNEEVLYDVSRSEGTVMQAGDSFSATNMNDLEQRIKTEFDNVNSSLTANGSQLCMDYHDGKYGVNTDPQRGADTFIPFHSDCDMKAIVTFTSNANNPAGYTTVYKGEDKLQSFAFNYNDSGEVIGLGFLNFKYNNGTATITALHDCIVNGKEYSKDEQVAKLTGYNLFKNYTFAIKI